MTADRDPADDPFFSEWNAHRSRLKRSLGRARLFAKALGLDFDSLPPAMVVVGSKGKGTAVTYATVALYSAGFRVGTISSPGFRSNRERIRLNGIALSHPEYDDLSAVVAEVAEDLPEVSDGYLSPSGLYTMAGLWYLRKNGATVLVVEEGLGGISDEVSLIPPEVVVVTRIFEEHLGIIGSNVEEIAHDLVGIVRPQTRQVWTLPQTTSVGHIIATIADSRLHTARLHKPFLESWRDAATSTVPGLSRSNADLGLAAGSAMAELMGRPVDYDLAESIGTGTSLPGRLSVHTVTTGSQLSTWIVDAAITPFAVRAALKWVLEKFGEPSVILAAFPDIKNTVACFGELQGRNVVAVTAGEHYLTYSQSDAPGRLVPSDEALAQASKSGSLIVCLGTMSFIAEVMEYLNVDTESYW